MHRATTQFPAQTWDPGQSPYGLGLRVAERLTSHILSPVNQRQAERHREGPQGNVILRGHRRLRLQLVLLRRGQGDLNPRRLPEAMLVQGSCGS